MLFLFYQLCIHVKLFIKILIYYHLNYEHIVFHYTNNLCANNCCIRIIFP